MPKTSYGGVSSKIEVPQKLFLIVAAQWYIILTHSDLVVVK
jgi:hypothetical protein